MLFPVLESSPEPLFQVATWLNGSNNKLLVGRSEVRIPGGSTLGTLESERVKWLVRNLVPNRRTRRYDAAKKTSGGNKEGRPSLGPTKSSLL